MRITVALLPHHPLPSGVDPARTTAVVVDVLRATSVIAAALAQGAARILTFESVAQAVAAAKTEKKAQSAVLLCGERHCQPIDGFDLGNSPADYTPQRVGGQTLILTTTNGTRALAETRAFHAITTACFLNLTAVLQRLQTAKHVHVVCAGTDGRVTGEDTLLAGAIAARCRADFDAELGNDEAWLAATCWNGLTGGRRLTDGALYHALQNTQGGRNLSALGFDDDIHRCAAIDSFPVVPCVTQRDPVQLCLGPKISDNRLPP